MDSMPSADAPLAPARLGPVVALIIARNASRMQPLPAATAVGPPGQGPGSEASTFRENTDTHSGKKSVVTSAHPPVLDIRSD